MRTNWFDRLLGWEDVSSEAIPKLPLIQHKKTGDLMYYIPDMCTPSFGGSWISVTADQLLSMETDDHYLWLYGGKNVH